MPNRKTPVLLLALSLLLAAGPAAGATTACPEHFQGGQAPEVLNPRLLAGTRALCYRAFAVLHSATTRTALYSAEHLTRDGIAAARGLPRDSEFHAEPALPPEERAELQDYARSGFDRGHMAPSGDMPDDEAQQESFSLANMVPQAPKLNRGTWADIEGAVRKLAERQGEIYVVTGPIFRGAELQRVGDVIVPTQVFKAVLDPRRGLAAAYVAKNVDSSPWAVVSMAQLADLTGLNVFPALPAAARTTLLRLPRPTPMPNRYGSRRRGNAP
jgi:endonuclease G